MAIVASTPFGRLIAGRWAQRAPLARGDYQISHGFTGFARFAFAFVFGRWLFPAMPDEPLGADVLNRSNSHLCAATAVEYSGRLGTLAFLLAEDGRRWGFRDERRYGDGPRSNETSQSELSSNICIL